MSENNKDHKKNGLLLSGLDGSNPLAFLAALGTLKTLTRAWPEHKVKMSWEQNCGTWRPRLEATDNLSQDDVIACLSEHLCCGFTPDTTLKTECAELQKDYQNKKAEIKKRREKVKKEGLSGENKNNAIREQIDPLQEEAIELRSKWLEKLSRVVPFPEMRIGKHLDSTQIEFRNESLEMMDNASRNNREPVDMMASFASDVCYDEETSRIQPSLFCFATGSGHQYFLDTSRQLVSVVTNDKLRSALFSRWMHRDEKFSMRWDPIEDRRYALMWSNPTDSDNKTLTNWAANLLAYRGLQFFPAMPTQSGLKTTSFVNGKYFLWPIWLGALSADLAGSLVASPTLASEKIDLKKIQDIGVVAVYRSERIIVGKPPLHKINFSVASALL